MATTKIPLSLGDAQFPASNYPTTRVVQGTNFPVLYLDFDASTEETFFLTLPALSYGSGNLTLRLRWNAVSATSGDVIWGAQLAAITPNTDSQDIETDSLATAQTVTDSHLGTTAKREHSCDITISNLDSLADDDSVWLKIYRDADAGGDTLVGDTSLIGAELYYSDS